MRAEEIQLGVGEKRELHVTLSRSNILALLHKLEMEGSARTIYSEDTGLKDAVLVLHAEDDAEHYAHRDREKIGLKDIRGQMHPDTETFIQEHPK